MAHEIMEHDNMLSVRQLPWHGLGTILDDYPTIQEAQKLSGLTWMVRKEPINFRMPAIDGMSRIQEIPNQFAIVRDDVNIPLGIVGPNYAAYQNDDMFHFMDDFLNQAGSKIETCGSLRNGKTVWALAQAGTTEYVKNDPTNQYFLFRNSFDGQSSIQVLFTDIRVVCQNTLSAALRHSNNIWSIRHTQAMHGYLQQVKDALFLQKAHSHEMTEAMRLLAKHSMSGEAITSIISDIVSFSSGELIDGQTPHELTKAQTKAMDTILDLHESGMGSDIVGVRGTAYGVLNAVTEYADHYKPMRFAADRKEAEVRFESVLHGASHELKTRAFNQLLSLVA